LSSDPDGEIIRWPSNGWLHGDIDDLANLCENVALSEQVLAAGLARLEQAVSDMATGWRRCSSGRPRCDGRGAQAGGRGADLPDGGSHRDRGSAP
jgi:hypothetical protein